MPPQENESPRRKGKTAICREKFRNMDQLGPNILTELHLNQDTAQNTYLGALVTLMV